MKEVPIIYTGDAADEAFGNLPLRDPKVMRAETEHAFEALRDIVARMRIGKLIQASRDGWLPPGCTDKDIDDAANGDGTERQCDYCGRQYRFEAMNFTRIGHAVCDECFAIYREGNLP